MTRMRMNLRSLVLNRRLVLQFYDIFFSKMSVEGDALYELSIQFSWQTLQRPLALLDVFRFIEEWRRRSCFFGLGCFSLQTFTWAIINELRMFSRPNVTPCARRSQLHGRHELCWGYLFSDPIFISLFPADAEPDSLCVPKPEWTLGIFTVEHVW